MMLVVGYAISAKSLKFALFSPKFTAVNLGTWEKTGNLEKNQGRGSHTLTQVCFDFKVEKNLNFTHEST